VKNVIFTLHIFLCKGLHLLVPVASLEMLYLTIFAQTISGTWLCSIPGLRLSISSLSV
jgi:hypothetical protein